MLPTKTTRTSTACRPIICRQTTYGQFDRWFAPGRDDRRLLSLGVIGFWLKLLSQACQAFSGDRRAGKRASKFQISSRRCVTVRAKYVDILPPTSTGPGTWKYCHSRRQGRVRGHIATHVDRVGYVDILPHTSTGRNRLQF